MSKRIFIAFPVPVNIREYLASVSRDLAEKHQEVAVNWVPSENMHLTVHFLGDLEDDKLDQVKARLAARANVFSAFTCTLAHVTAYPSPRVAKIIVAEVKPKENTPKVMWGVLAKDFMRLGLETDKKPWTPHITLGRVKKGEISNLSEMKLERMSWLVDSVKIFSSELGPDGSKYTGEGEFKLVNREI